MTCGNLEILRSEIMHKLIPLLSLSIVMIILFKPKAYQYKITYELTYQPDSTDVHSTKQEKMFLYLGDRTSRFSSAGKAIGDSLQSTFDYTNFNQEAFMRMRNEIPSTHFKYVIYKGVFPGKVTYSSQVVTDKYYYSQDKDIFDWKIHSERDTIAGFAVQKATSSFAGRDYTAWFTNEVPISDGPYKFCGLPGLIVQIADDKNNYVFQLKQLQKLRIPMPAEFQENELMETTQKRLLELEGEFESDPVGFTKRSIPGATIKYGAGTDPKKIERERRERLRKRNNPIELSL